MISALERDPMLNDFSTITAARPAIQLTNRVFSKNKATMGKLQDLIRKQSMDTKLACWMPSPPARNIKEAPGKLFYQALKQSTGDKWNEEVSKTVRTLWPKGRATTWSTEINGTTIAAGGDEDDDLVTTIVIREEIVLAGGKIKIDGKAVKTVMENLRGEL